MDIVRARRSIEKIHTTKTLPLCFWLCIQVTLLYFATPSADGDNASLQ